MKIVFAFAVVAGAVFVSGLPADEPRTAAGYRKDTEVVAEESVSHPTVKCEHIHPVGGQADRENHGACESHCRTLGEEYEGGRCNDEVCHCRRKASTPGRPEGQPTVKCVDLIPEEGSPSAENHEGCRAHCSTLKNGYERGQCERGVCHCLGGA